MKNKKSDAAILAEAWQRKGSTISLSRERRATLKKFADLHGGLSPAEAIYLLIDGIKPETSSVTNTHSTDTPKEMIFIAPENSALVELRERLNQVDGKVDDNSETLLQCAESLEQIANAMEPLQALITKLVPPTVQPTRLSSSQWIRMALKAIGGSSESTLRAQLRHLKNSTPSSSDTAEFLVDALAIDNGSMRRVRDGFPTLIIKGAAAKAALDKQSQSTVKGVFHLLLGKEEKGQRRARIFLIENGSTAGTLLFEWPIHTKS